ncbi:MAG: DUF1223 domain-containing protein [Opitutales bacterium]
MVFATSGTDSSAAIESLAQDGQSVVVVELFTSQGCSSCPPADKLLGELADKPGILALSYHVDYWDYLGWKDPYSSALATERQRAYAQNLKARGLYTPQAVIDGRLETVGSSRSKVLSLIAESLKDGPDRDVLIEVVETDGGYGIVVDGAQGTTLKLVEYLPLAETAIPRGENRGRTLTEHNVVTDLKSLGNLRDKVQRVEVGAGDLRSDRAYAVLVQVRGQGPILAAAQVRRSQVLTSSLHSPGR